MLFGSDRRISINIPMPQVFINKSQLARAEYLLKNMPNTMRQAYDRGCLAFATRVLRIIKRAMATGMPPPGSGVSWAPLKEKTLKMYEKWGYSGAHPWYVIPEMHRLVTTYRNSRGDYYVGFKRNVRATNPNSKSTSSRPTLSHLSHILEMDGDMHTGRPLWDPAFKSAGGKAKLGELVVKELRAQVRALKGWTVDSKGYIRDSKNRISSDG